MASSANRLAAAALLLSIFQLLGGCSRLTATGGSTAGAGPGPSFFGSGSQHFSVGLSSIVPETNRLAVGWTSENLLPFGGDFALFISTDRATLFSAPPLMVDIALESHIFTGLLDQTEYFVGIAIAETSGASLIPRGEALCVKTGSFYYVDQDAPSVGADGLSPATAFPVIFPAIITAFLNGGGNVLVRAGVYVDTALPVLAGVNIYGGYSVDFALENRDTAMTPSILEGLAGDSIMTLEAVGLQQRVDGFVLDGLGASVNGIDLDQTPAQLTNLIIRNCSRGMRLRSANIFDPTEVAIANVQCLSNRLEGLSLQGIFNVTIENSLFQSNGQEGLEFGPWMAPSGESVCLIVSNCRFLANGAEGFDVDMVAAPVIGSGGRFELEITDCDFTQNAFHGCLVDVDFETSPAWMLELSIRGSQALGNGASGFALDIDSSSTCNLQRLVASGNLLDGIQVTSESYAAMVLISASALVGNLRYGVHSSLGNVGVALSHCLLAGNAGGGILDEIAPATLSSCAAHLQANPFGSAYLRGTPDLNSALFPFTFAPTEYRTLFAQSGDTLTLDAALGTVAGVAAELGADGILRILDSSAGTNVRVTPSPSGLTPPALFTVFPSSGSVEENYAPALGSPLIGAGMQPPVGAAVDAGPFGSSRPGKPGIEDLIPSPLFWASSQIPAWGQAIGASADLRIQFMGGTPDPASLAAGVRAVDAFGADIAATALVVGGELVLQAPAGGWQTGDLVELHGSMTDLASGIPLLPITILVGAD